MTSKQQFQILIAVACGCLLPYFLLCLCAFPLADDYCFAWEMQRHPSFTNAFQSIYRGWTGRYTAVLLVLFNPFQLLGLAAYQLTAAFGIIAGVVINFLLVRFLVKRKTTAIILALALQLAYQFQMPVLSEGLYWFNGYAVYYWSNLLFGFWLWLLLQYHFKSSKLAVMVAILLLPVLVGFNELILVVVTAFLTGWFLIEKEKRPVIAVMLLLALLGGAFLVLAPGNAVRAAQSTAPHQLLHALVFSQFQVFRFAASWCSLPIALLCLLTMVFAGPNQFQKLKQIKIPVILIAIYGIIFFSVFLPLFFSGMLGQHRTLNFAWWFTLPLTLLLSVKISEKFHLSQKLLFLKTPSFFSSTLIAAMLLMALNQNGASILYDLSKGTLQAYRAEILNRMQLLEQGRYNNFTALPAIKNRPQSIFLYDEKDPKIWWQDKCTIEYFRNASGVPQH
ncbi:MAG: DUF6056 family protein [Chitinophagales bacterium]